MPPVLTPDFAITGAGIIGLTLALELHARGASVAVLDTAAALGGASRAAAGMLAAEDPHNPAELHELSAFSISLYDRFLERLSASSGVDVPYQTTTTIQYLDDGRVMELREKSVDPRQLGAAALEAVRRSGIPLLENCERIEINKTSGRIALCPLHGPAVAAGRLIHASGAWFAGQPAITPRKGQMLRVRLPSNLPLDQVHRSSSFYVVPRIHGPQAGTALIGATEEDAGFDVRTRAADLAALRLRAAALLPALVDSTAAPQVEAWAGLRPAAADGLPLIGKLPGILPGSTPQWIAGGHYRNGILLAPATAHVLADLLEGKPVAINLRPFDPARLMQ
ncbi:MAG TPA: FAD-dependent oxidoreductase [Bryocella sp.]|nr:FAD-dependent oxidoreductase [Bryocella sp.]